MKRIALKRIALKRIALKRIALLFILFFFSVSLVFSFDFGLLLDQNFEAENGEYSYIPALTPWFSWDFGNGMSVYFSGVVSLKYNSNEGWRDPLILPEISLFSITYRNPNGLSVEAGRIGYADIADFTASGLFDGIRFSLPLAMGDISGGLYYTGLLYKETARIIMTGTDERRYAGAADDFSGYIASKRLFAALRWDMPLRGYNNLSIEVLAQVDLNEFDVGEYEEILDSQYVEARLEFFFGNSTRLSGGLVLETIQSDTEDFAAAFGVLGMLKTDVFGFFNDALTLSAKYSSASRNETFTAFIPITSINQGMIFSESLGSLFLIKAGYEVRISTSLFAEASASFFWRSYDDSESGSLFYGPEFWASFIWQPFDDVRAVFGGGVFLPGLGSVFSDPNAMWKINAGVMLSF